MSENSNTKVQIGEKQFIVKAEPFAFNSDNQRQKREYQIMSACCPICGSQMYESTGGGQKECHCCGSIFMICTINPINYWYEVK